MSAGSPRLARARDFALIVAGSASFVLGALFAAGRIWFHALFASALDGEPFFYAGGFLIVAVVFGAAYAVVRPPRS